MNDNVHTAKSLLNLPGNLCYPVRCRHIGPYKAVGILTVPSDSSFVLVSIVYIPSTITAR